MSGDESGIPRFPFTEINKEEYSPDEFVNTMSRYLLREFSYEKLEDHSHEALDRKADELYKYLHFVYSSFVHKNYVMADEMELARTIHEDAPYLPCFAAD